MRILIDVDGPVAHFHKRFVEVTNSTLGTNYRIEESLNNRNVELSLGLSQDSIDRVYSKVNGPGFADSLEPINGAIQTITELAQTNEIVFVTHQSRRSVTWVTERSQWLINNFGEEIGSNVVFTKLKYIVHGDIFIEDTISHADQWMQERERLNQRAVAFMYHWPYNTHSNHPKLNRWSELPGLIKKYFPE